MKNKIILITGSSGFIGGIFLESALKKGFYVIDILRKKNQKNKKLNDLKKRYKKNYQSIFFTKYSDLKSKLKNKRINYFINFATHYKNTHMHTEIPTFIDSNIIFPSIVTDLVINKLEKIINLGTMMQHTDGKEYSPKNFYASTKSALEMILRFYKIQSDKVKIYNLKFFESFSELDNRKKLIPIIIDNFKKNIKTNIISKKLELNIIHVNDIINAIYILLKMDIKEGSYCLKQPKNLKIKNLISNLNKNSNKKIKVKYLNQKIKSIKKNYIKILPFWKPDTKIVEKIKDIL